MKEPQTRQIIKRAPAGVRLARSRAEMPVAPRRTLASCGWAALAVVAATIARVALSPAVGSYSVPFVTYFPAVVVSAWLGGFVPGALAVALSAVVACFLFIPPPYSLHLTSASEAWSLAIFIVSGLGAAAIGEAQHRSLTRYRELSALTQRSEEEARGNRDLLLTTLHSIRDGVIVIDANGRITLMNAVAEALTGWTESEARARSAEQVFHAKPPESAEAAGSASGPLLASDFVAGGANISMLTSRNGEEYAIEESRLPIHDAAGMPNGFVLTIRDVTGRNQKEAERRFLVRATEALASSLDYEQTLQKVADLAVPRIADWCGVDMVDRKGNITPLAVAHVNPEKVKWGKEMRRLYPTDPAAPRGLPNVLRTGQSEIYSDISDEMLVAGARDKRHLQMIRELGLDSLMIVAIKARGTVLGAITFVATNESGHHFTDADLELAEALAARAALAIENARLYREAQAELAERTRTQERLRESEERFRFSLANSDISVYIADRDLRYTWAYRGRDSGEIKSIYGKTDEEFLEAEDAAALREVKMRVLRTGVEERHEMRATFIGGEPGYYDTLFSPLRNNQGEIIGITGTVSSVTERRKAHDALEKHQAEIEALNTRLVRSMRETHHRVKNNLQVVSALVNMQQMQYEDHVPVTELARLTQHIVALAAIHDLLTHQAQTDSDVADISVTAVMDKLMPTVHGMVTGRGVRFEVQEIRLPVRHSTTLAVLVNELVSNALKHGAGDVVVRFSAESGEALLEVLDQGPGFPAGFDPAVAANTGLDLIESLARTDLRGSASYENRPEGGGRVAIRFPLPSLARTPGEQ